MSATKGKPDLLGDRLRLAHTNLFEDLQKLEKAIGEQSAAGRENLLTRLHVTREHVAAHFTLEEQNGYMDALPKREPQVAKAIESLAQDHQELRESFRNILAEVEALATLEKSAHAHVRDWIRRLRRHEERENDLVQEAFNRDLGSKD